jgi:dolichol-phosphate mannosyltransferase
MFGRDFRQARSRMILAAVLPTYNEAGSLAQVVGDLLRLELPGIEVHLLIVDDDSPDGTGRLADELSRQAPARIDVLHRERKQGLASAYLAGFARVSAAGADLVAQLDADRSHDPMVLAAMVDAIRDADVVIGSRYVDKGGVDAQWAWYRRLLSWVANRAVVPTLLSLPVSDATSGYRLWRSEVLARIAPLVRPRSGGYGFQVETAYVAHRLGYRLREVPIHFRERESGRSKMSLGVKLATVREILAIRRGM